jgi:putative chitinase
MKLPDSLKSVMSAKILGKPKESSPETPESLDEKKDKVTPLKQIADNFAALPDIAKSLNITRQNIYKLVKLEGGEGTKADNLAPVAGSDTSPKALSDVNNTSPTPNKKAEAGGKKGGIMSKLGPLLKVGAIIFALSQIPGGFIKDIFDGIVDTIKELASALWEEISTAFTSLLDTFKKWFGEVVDPILQQIKDFLKPIWEKITEFFKPIFDWVGDKIKTVIETLQPVFDFMKGVFDKITGVLKGLMERYEPLRQAVEKAQNFLGLGPKKPELPKEVKGPLEKNKTTTTNNETAAEKVKKNLTPSQLRWLGGADATDPYIMSRMPPPQPGEKGGPPAQPGQPAPQAPAAPPSQAPTTRKEGEKPLEVSGIQATIVKSLNESGVTSPKAHANVLATVKAESNFKVQSENLLYSSAQRIQDVFGKKRIPSVEDAQSLVKNPEALANQVYKTTDGNSAPGDGFKYRGRGFIQHTGKNQYAAISKFTGVDVLSNPDLLNSPEIAAKAIPWFLLSYKGLKPDDVENMSKVNKAIAFADPTGKKAAEREASAQQIQASMSGGSTGSQVASASTQVAADQRQQQKPQTPVVINAPSTTNTTVVKNETKTTPINTANSGANALLSRQT